jgi:toxin ParE1/3/4
VKALILPAARERLLGIWNYTSEAWGDEQADDYVSGLISHAQSLPQQRLAWRAVKERRFHGIFFTRYRHHYLFFREFPNGTIGVLSILHENMDLPRRLKEDVGSDG